MINLLMSLLTNYAENEPIAHIDLYGLQQAAAPITGMPVPGTTSLINSTSKSVNWRNMGALNPQPLIDVQRRIDSEKGFSNTSGGPNASIKPEGTQESVLPELVQQNIDREVKTDNSNNEDNEDVITLYRGVEKGFSNGMQHKLALMGVAVPRGLENGHADAGRHNAQDTKSIFTS